MLLTITKTISIIQIQSLTKKLNKQGGYLFEK